MTNGADALVASAVACGIDVCFANPGTTEMAILAALDRNPVLRPILGLTESVCAGAADGYGRMRDAPALTLTHTGVGLANMVATLNNAKRAASPVVNVVGSHPTWHARHDTPLAMDLEGLARIVSSWFHCTPRADCVADDLRAAVAHAAGRPGRIATLAVPADAQWDPASPRLHPAAARELDVPDTDAVESCAKTLRERGTSTALLLAGYALRSAPLGDADDIARRSGCALLMETFPARAELGTGAPALTRLPYFPEQARQALASYTDVIAVGGDVPRAIFGYRGGSSELVPDGVRFSALSGSTVDPSAALRAVADRLPHVADAPTRKRELPPVPSGRLTPHTIAAALVRCQPTEAIVVDESATSGGAYSHLLPAAAPFTYLTLTGGAIGFGLPCAVGAAIASPARRVLCLQADGGGLYSPQALWTAAREQLDVTVLVFANRSYRILQIEAARADAAGGGDATRKLTELSLPAVDWAGIARSFGVPASRVDTADALVCDLARALATAGPTLIEVTL